MFSVRQNVVCVDAADTNVFGVTELTVGAIYVVRWFGIFDWGEEGVHSAVRLNGVRRYVPFPWLLEQFPREFADVVDVPFGAYRFRPLVERKTDISIFKRMLIPTELEPVR